VNDSATPPPDWGSIFHRARRRIAGRLLLVGAIGAAGAVLLLGGGLEAQGSVSLGLGFHGVGKHEEARVGREVRRTEGKKRVDKQRKRRQVERRHRRRVEPKPIHHPKHCVEKPETSAETEYGRWEWPNGARGNKSPSAGAGG
jgi:hypothetical protein